MVAPGMGWLGAQGSGLCLDSGCEPRLQRPGRRSGSPPRRAYERRGQRHAWPRRGPTVGATGRGPRPRWRPRLTQGAVRAAGAISQVALRRESRPPAASPENFPRPPRAPKPRALDHGGVSAPRQQEATLKSHGASGGSRPPRPLSGAARAPGGWAAAACRDTVWGGAREQCQSLPTGCQRRGAGMALFGEFQGG